MNEEKGRRIALMPGPREPPGIIRHRSALEARPSRWISGAAASKHPFPFARAAFSRKISNAIFSERRGPLLHKTGPFTFGRVHFSADQPPDRVSVKRPITGQRSRRGETRRKEIKTIQVGNDSRRSSCCCSDLFRRPSWRTRRASITLVE